MTTTLNKIDEVRKCKDNFQYFCEQYLRPFQTNTYEPIVSLTPTQQFLSQYHDTKKLVYQECQKGSGLTSFAIFEIIHYILFNPNKFIGIMAPNKALLDNIRRELKTIYDMLPDWLQVPYHIWNRDHARFDTGTVIHFMYIDIVNLRGRRFDYLFVEEPALDKKFDEEFVKTLFPAFQPNTVARFFSHETPLATYFDKFCVKTLTNKLETITFPV